MEEETEGTGGLGGEVGDARLRGNFEVVVLRSKEEGTASG